MTAFAPAPSGSKEVVASQIPPRTSSPALSGLLGDPRLSGSSVSRRNPESTSKHSPTRRRQSSNIFGETEITESETLRLEEGRIVLSPASMEELPDEVVQLNDLVAERLPRVELAKS